MKTFFQKETSGEGSNASIVNLKNTTSKTNPHSFNNPFVNSMETAEISHVFNTPGSVYQPLNSITVNYIVESKLQVTKIHIELKNEIKHEQPLLKEYPKSKFVKETFTRQFNPRFNHNVYPRLSYSVVYNQCTCYPCARVNQDTSFTYSNWKKSGKLEKHNKSKKHLPSMAKHYLAR